MLFTGVKRSRLGDGNHSTAETVGPSFQERLLGVGTTGTLMHNSGRVAQPARRVKDKRLRRAFGILDTVHWLGFVMVKGLLPTPVEQV